MKISEPEDVISNGFYERLIETLIISGIGAIIIIAIGLFLGIKISAIIIGILILFILCAFFTEIGVKLKNRQKRKKIENNAKSKVVHPINIGDWNICPNCHNKSKKTTSKCLKCGIMFKNHIE